MKNQLNINRSFLVSQIFQWLRWRLYASGFHIYDIVQDGCFVARNHLQPQQLSQKPTDTSTTELTEIHANGGGKRVPLSARYHRINSSAASARVMVLYRPPVLQWRTGGHCVGRDGAADQPGTRDRRAQTRRCWGGRAVGANDMAGAPHELHQSPDLLRHSAVGHARSHCKGLHTHDWQQHGAWAGLRKRDDSRHHFPVISPVSRRWRRPFHTGGQRGGRWGRFTVSELGSREGRKLLRGRYCTDRDLRLSRCYFFFSSLSISVQFPVALTLPAQRVDLPHRPGLYLFRATCLGYVSV